MRSSASSVEGLNKIVHTYGFKMLDIEPIREVDVEIDSAQFQTDWQRNLFADVDRLHFFRPSPIVVDNRDAFCIRHPDDRNLVYVSGVKVNSGEVFVIGQSLLLKFFSEAARNQRLLANLSDKPTDSVVRDASVREAVGSSHVPPQKRCFRPAPRCR